MEGLPEKMATTATTLTLQYCFKQAVNDHFIHFTVTSLVD